MATTDYEAVPDIARDDARRVGTLVMKFGGTSVGNPERLLNVARRIVAAKEEGGRVVAVLSAMGDTTDELVDLAHRISDRPKPRAMDMLISVGERISCALAEMAIEDLGHQAISLTGSQAGIVTDTTHTKAKIVEVRAQRIHAALDEGKIVLVAGFQGVSTGQEITTLGRGGSDTTAVALAAALGAESCQIFTDVEGVYTADPRLVPGAQKLPVLTYEEMLEMSASGAKVMALRSVEFARNHGVRLHVRSTFSESEGTWIREEDERVAGEGDHLGCHPRHLRGEADADRRARPARRRRARLPRARRRRREHRHDRPERLLARAHRHLLHAAEVRPRRRRADPRGRRARTSTPPAGRTTPTSPRSRLIGAGMRSHPGVAADMFEALAEAGINIEIISTSSIRISCVVRAADVERAVQAVHDKFQLVAEERASA